MKNFYGSLILIVVIVAHIAARFVMKDAYTFSISDYSSVPSIHSITAISDQGIQLSVQANYKSAAFVSNSFYINNQADFNTFGY